MAEIAGMQHECWRSLERVDLVDGDMQRTDHVLVRGFIEADVAVADLDEAELALQLVGGVFAHIAQCEGLQHSALQHKECSGPSPSHALEESATIDTVVAMVFVDVVRHTASCVKLLL